MLRVTIELIPGGDERRKRIIGTAEIVNDGSILQSSNGKRSNYRVTFNGKRGRWRTAYVTDFPRKSYNAWHLLHRALYTVIQYKPNGK